MKFFALAFVAAVSAQAEAGEDCSAEPFICQNTGTVCVKWTDSTAMENASCQDCQGADRTVTDSAGEAVPFKCADDVEEGSTTLYASAAALLAAATIMA